MPGRPFCDPAVPDLLKILAKGLVGRLLAYAVFGLGFWLLFQGFSNPSAPRGVLGGVMILIAMYLMVLARRSDPDPEMTGSAGEGQENSGDSLDGSDKGGQLPP